MRTLMDPNVFPPALRGIMLAAFAAAYMSTIGTQLNWGASYVVNDFYRRFLRRDGREREYVVVSQIVTVALSYSDVEAGQPVRLRDSGRIIAQTVAAAGDMASTRLASFQLMLQPGAHTFTADTVIATSVRARHPPTARSKCIPPPSSGPGRAARRRLPVTESDRKTAA